MAIALYKYTYTIEAGCASAARSAQGNRRGPGCLANYILGWVGAEGEHVVRYCREVAVQGLSAYCGQGWFVPCRVEVELRNGLRFDAGFPLAAPCPAELGVHSHIFLRSV